MAGKIFVNYRRDDDPAAAARVRDGLAARFGKASVFMDVDNLLAGQRFDAKLAAALAACDVLIAVIGEKWMGILRERMAAMEADPDERDYVREEIAAALQRGIVVIPVRVGRDGKLAALPRPSELPADIRDLVAHQKHDVRYETHGRDLGDLIEAIQTVRRESRPQAGTRLPWSLLAVAIAGLSIAGYAGAYYAGAPVPWPLPAPVQQGPTASEKARAEAEERQRVAAAEIEKERQARTKAEAENKRLAEVAEKAQRELDARQKAEAESKRKAEEAERQRLAALKAEEDRQRAAADAKRKADEEAARRVPQPGQTFRDCNDGCPEMVVVPAGSFTMGSPANEAGRDNDEGPQRRVTIAQPFAVGKFEVTFAEWDACVAASGCQHKPEASWGRGKQPVMRTSWDDAKKYVAWLSRKTGKSYRLLSEAEWEYAARAGTTTPFSTGPTITTSQANFDGNYTYGGSAKGQNRQRTAEVGSFPANQFGLHDMHGNVWEWVEDCWHDNYNGAPTDGRAWTTACSDNSRRVLRGGSWNYFPQDLRSAYRIRYTTGIRDDDLGFRVGRTF